MITEDPLRDTAEPLRQPQQPAPVRLIELPVRWLCPDYTRPLGVTFTREDIAAAVRRDGVLGTFNGVTCVVASPCKPFPSNP